MQALRRLFAGPSASARNDKQSTRMIHSRPYVGQPSGLFAFSTWLGSVTRHTIPFGNQLPAWSRNAIQLTNYIFKETIADAAASVSCNQEVSMHSVAHSLQFEVLVAAFVAELAWLRGQGRLS